MSLLFLALYLCATLFTLGLGVVAILLGAGVITFAVPSPFFVSAVGIGILFFVGAVLLVIAIHFVLLAYRRQVSAARFSQEGEWGRIELSPYALREFISGILREEVGIDRFRVRLRHQEEGISIRIQTALSPHEQVAAVGRRIQETLSQRVVERTGVEVQEVSVLVDSIRAREEEPVEREEEDTIDGDNS